MERKVIFFDIDGTLISEKTGEVPESAVEAIHKAQKNGHLAVINTGRTFRLLHIKEMEKVLEIGFDAFICGCGTRIIYRGETLFHRSVEEDMARKVVNALKKYKINGILEGDRDLFMDKSGTKCPEKWQIFNDLYLEVSKSWDSPEVSMDKLYTMVNPESDLDGFRKELEGDFDFIDRERGFYEIVPHGCTKASGIQKLIDHLGISLADTISIGDSNNDLPMLTYTAVSIAMGRHSEGLQDKVDYITKTVEEDGIYHALSHYGLIAE